jgi:uncharacterized protein with GYD domain
MPYYACFWSFTTAAVKAMTEKPQNRVKPVRAVVEGFGGKLHHYYFMFGKHDGMGIVEFPDNETAVAASMRFSSSGALARFETHPLMTAEEAERSMERVKKAGINYVPPTG